jgi:hypothetical protein
VTIVAELVTRGVDAPDGLSRTDWLRAHDPSLTAAQAKAFVTVGTAIADPSWARLLSRRKPTLRSASTEPSLRTTATVRVPSTT